MTKIQPVIPKEWEPFFGKNKRSLLIELKLEKASGGRQVNKKTPVDDTDRVYERRPKSIIRMQQTKNLIKEAYSFNQT